MHYAKLNSSPRLKKVYRALYDAYYWQCQGVMSTDRGLTTRELIDATGCCAINSIISELRRNGFLIDCRCVRRGVYEYRLL